jgi:hypothetical protein
MHCSMQSAILSATIMSDSESSNGIEDYCRATPACIVTQFLFCLREFARLDRISSRHADTRHRDTKRRNVRDSCTRIAKAFGTTTEGAIDATKHTSRVASAVDREPYQKQPYPHNSSATARVRNMFKTAFAAVNHEYSSEGEDNMLMQLQSLMNAYLEAAVMVEALLGDLGAKVSDNDSSLYIDKRRFL